KAARKMELSIKKLPMSQNFLKWQKRHLEGQNGPDDRGMADSTAKQWVLSVGTFPVKIGYPHFSMIKFPMPRESCS
ncbi:hypothetical protein, partial [Pseudoalteromonas sp. SWYJZ12]|uniref:hypothetical protein n=1 Tax=Pseudoalteromonas sp. SWYJZ12 TaxID=2792067 RepID=UPI001E3414EF